MPALPGVPPDISLLTGPMLLGNLFAYGLFGILCVQVFIYNHKFPNDPVWTKALVYVLFSVDTIITIFATVAAWDSMAQGWGDLTVLAPLDWPFGPLPLLSGFVASSVHFFFCWRIYRLAKSPILPAIIAVISIAAWITAAYCGIKGLQLGIVHIGDLKPFVIVWLGGSTLCDFLITIVMCYILFRQGSKSAFKATNSLVAKLIRLTVETGMTTAAGALTELVLFLVFPANNMHFLPFLMLAKLYSNTMLATLNSRASFNENRSAVKQPFWDDQSSSASGGQINTVRSFAGINVGRRPEGVQVTTFTERRDDMELTSVREPTFYDGDKKPYNTPL